MSTLCQSHILFFFVPAYGLTHIPTSLPAHRWRSLHLLTIVHDVLIPVKALAAIGQVGLGAVDRPDHTFVAQVAHEELQTDEGEDAQAEDGQDHHVRKLLHRLDQGAHNGLQAWRAATHTRTQTMQVMQELQLPQV